MMMLRVKKSFSLFMLTALFVHAVCADIFDTPLSAQNERAFSAVCERLSAHAVQTGKFTQTKSIAKLKRDLVSSGTYIISQADGIVWNTQKPFPSVMAVTKTGIIQTSASGRKTKLDATGNATFEQFSAVISSVFQGNAAVLKEHFTIYFDGTDDRWTCALVPKDGTLQSLIAHITMSGTDTIQTILMREANGDVVTYAFADQQVAGALTAQEKTYFIE